MMLSQYGCECKIQIPFNVAIIAYLHSHHDVKPLHQLHELKIPPYPSHNSVASCRPYGVKLL